MNPKDTQRFRRNEYYKSAIHAAVEYPDLAMLMWEGGKSASQEVESADSLLPGTKQVDISHPSTPPRDTPREIKQSDISWPSVQNASHQPCLGPI